MPRKTRRYNVQEELSKWLTNAHRVVLAGIGNPIRKDDFIGVRIVQDLEGRVSKRVFLIECETVPESFVEQIVDFDPTHVLLIDAAILGVKPGDSRLVKPEELTSTPAVSTHMLPLHIFCEYLSKTIRAKIALLLIQPKDTEFGEGLSPEIAASAQKISETLLQALRREKLTKQ